MSLYEIALTVMQVSFLGTLVWVMISLAPRGIDWSLAEKEEKKK